ncbi:MAG TPA: hypothetical protein VFC09_01230 [Candidatus Dormibacteraeota bacterium]|nr:hypothetical protein [Candidatus Dormibacteraeota bacterium]
MPSTSRGAWLRVLLVPAALTAVQLRGMGGGGYVLLPDAVFGPRPAPVPWNLTTPVAAVVHLASSWFGGAATGRAVVALALVLAGVGPMVLLRALPWWAQCAGGLLGMLNPWTYDRVVEGQWAVVCAAALLFLWLAAWEALRARPGLRPALAAGLCAVVAVSFSPNFLGILAVLAIGAVIAARAWRSPPLLRWTAVGAGVAALLLIPGIAGFAAGSGAGTYQQLQGAGVADFTAYRSVPDPRFGLVPSLLGLYGEWAEGTGRFAVASDGTGWWPLAAAVLVGLALLGAWRSPQRRWLLAVGLLGVLLSASTATSWGLSAAGALAEHVPLLAAYREPQKWLALWLVALVVLDAEALAAARGREAPALGIAMLAAILLPAGVTQLRELPQETAPAAYPADWEAAAAALDQAGADGQAVLVLPWHLYEPLPFTGRLAANPAPVVFPGELVASQDPELPGAAPMPSPQGVGGLSLTVTDPAPCALATAVRATGVRFVVVENVAGGAGDRARLAGCGFHVLAGGAGETTVLSP